MPFPDLPERLREVLDRVDAALQRGGHGQSVTIVAVTKTHGPEAVTAAWESGLENVGENRIQEALAKMDAVRVPVRWHLIGHLQRNKARHVWRFDLVHSLDSPRLADAVDEIGRATGRLINILVQVNVAGESSKGGYAPAILEAEADRLCTMSGLRVRGVMTMAPFGADQRTLREVFGGARRAGEILRSRGHEATELSMGMSNDFEVAVEEGATFIRLGTILFGPREGGATA